MGKAAAVELAIRGFDSIRGGRPQTYLWLRERPL